MRRSRSKVQVRKRVVGLPPAASLGGDEVFVSGRGRRLAAQLRRSRRSGGGGTPRLEFSLSPDASLPAPSRHLPDVDGQVETRRIHERRVFEAGADAATPGPAALSPTV